MSRIDAPNLFVYGTLMVPAIMRSVTGRPCMGISGRLYDHARYRIEGEYYPGLVPSPGDATDGLVYTGIDIEAVRRLDRFEGEMYQRTDVLVTLPDCAIVSAQTYLLRPEYAARLTDEPWDLERFKAREQDLFLRTYTGFGSIKPDKKSDCPPDLKGMQK